MGNDYSHELTEPGASYSCDFGGKNGYFWDVY
jgi:hypothetical protein